MSQIESLLCNQCSAPLAIPRGTSYVTCSYCHTNLKVHWEDSISYTEKIEKLAEQNQQMLIHIAELQYKQAFDALLKHWEIEQKQYMIEKSDGSYRAPTEPLIPPMVAVIAILTGLTVAATGFAFHTTSLMVIGAIIFTVGGASIGDSSEKVAAYQLAQQKYEEKIKNLKQEDFYQKLLSGSSKEGKQYVQSSFLQVLAAYQQKLSSF